MPAPSVDINQDQKVMGNSAGSPWENTAAMTSPSFDSALSATYSVEFNGSKIERSVAFGEHWGGRFAFSTARDFTGSDYIAFNLGGGVWPFGFVSANLDTLANGGISIFFYDGAANWSEYNIYGSEYDLTFDAADGGWVSFRGAEQSAAGYILIERARAADNTSGTLDWTDVNGFELHFRDGRTSGSAETCAMSIQGVGLYSDAVITDGTSSDKGTFQDFTDAYQAFDNGWALFEFFKPKSGNFSGYFGGIYEPRISFAIGDGTTLTEFSETDQTVSWYPSIGTQATMPHVLTTTQRGCTINQSASDDVDFNNVVWTTANYAGGDAFWECTGNTSGACDVVNNIFYYHEYVTVGHATFSGTTFDDCDQVEIDANSAMTGCVIRNCVGNGLYTEAAAGDFSAIDVEFAATNTNYDLTINPTSTGTWDFTGLSVESGHTLTIRNESATVAITVTVAAGLSTSTSTAGGTVTVNQATTDFTINSNVSASIFVFTTGTQTVLDSATSATQLVFTHTGQTVDYTVAAAGYYPQRFTNVTLSGTTSTTVNLIAEPFYNSGHTLTYTTDASHDRALNQLSVPSFGPSGQDVWSLMSEEWVTRTALRNTEFPYQLNGPESFFLNNDAEGATDADIENLTECGVRYVSAAGATTASWFGIKDTASDTFPGGTGEYQQIDGSTTTDARASGRFNEVIKMYGDATHGNFDYRGHAVFKYQLNGYQQSRVDLIAANNITTLDPRLYSVSLPLTALSASTGDPAISITITDHTAAPITVGGLLFDYEVVDNGTNSAEDILREINYNLSLDATYQGKDPFNWPDIVVEEGSNYATAIGFVEGQDTTTTDHGFYVSRSSADHPDFARFQSNTGVYYTPATVAQVSAPNVTAGRIQIVNETGRTASAWAASTAYVLYNKVLRSTGTGSESGVGLYFQCTTAGTTGGTEPTWDTTPGNTTADGTAVWTCRAIEFDNTTTTSGYSNSWTDHEDFDSGDTIRMRWVDSDELEIAATGVATAAGITTFLDSPVDDTVYDGYGIDGSTVTEYSADYPNVQVDLNDSDNVFYIDRFYAWHKYNLTTADGIRNFFGAVTATNASNILINNDVVDIFFDNTKAVSARQGGTIVLQRSDGAYPQVTVTSGGGGLGFYYAGIGYTVETGVSGLTAQESTNLALIGTVDTNVDLLVDDAGLNASQPKTITENTVGTSYDESVNGVTKEIRKSGSTTTITRTA